MVEKSDDGPLTGGPRKEHKVPRVKIFYGLVVGDKGLGMRRSYTFTGEN